MTPLGVNKLFDCAKAIEDGELFLADSLIKDVLAGNDDKLVKYFVEALVRRVYRIYPKNPRPLVPSCTDLRFNRDYQFFPFFMFAGLTARSAIPDALAGKKRIQVIDFSLIASGERCCSLLNNYVKRSPDAISIHLTSIGPILNEILEKLPAKAIKLPNKCEMKHVVANTPAEIVEAALNLERSSEDETIVVIWEFELHKLLAQPGATESVLSKLKELKPEIMIVVEQEANLNGQDFLKCFSNSIHYYSIVFDSLDKDNFDDSNHCKVLWEMYFRRQISNLVGQQSTDKIVRLKTFSEWRETLFHSGFHHVRLQTQFKGLLFDHLPEYRIEERNRHPVLYRDDDPLLFTSTWKPDPTQPNSESSGSWNQVSSLRAEATIPGGSSGPPILAGTVSSSSLLDDEPDDPHVIIEGNVWSPECFSINQIAASAEIFDMMEDICHVHYLPLALTWMSDRRVLHLEKSACYLNDFAMVEFMEACGEHHLEEGKGVAGKALQLNSMYLVSDISDPKENNDVKGFPSISDSWDFGLHGVVAIKLASVRISSINYVLEFFLPPEMKQKPAQRLLVNEIVSILEKNYRNSWRVCNEELSRANIGSEVEIMAEEVGTATITPAAIPASQPLEMAPPLIDTLMECVKAIQELSEIGSLNSSQIRELCNIKPPGDEVRVPETHDQEVDSSQPLEMAPPLIDTLMECVKAIEELSEIGSLNSSQIRELCNIKPPGDEVRVPETHDQEVDSSQPLEMAPPLIDTLMECVKAIEELSEIGSLNSSQIRELCNIKPPGDEVRVPETHDQEVEQQNSTFRPAADLFPEYEVDGVDSYHFNAGTSSKRRRTSDVWQYFDEVRENGEVWAKCRNCSAKYRGESTRGTTNLRKHLRSCAGKK